MNSPSLGRTTEGFEFKKLALSVLLWVLTAAIAWCSASVSTRVNPERGSLAGSESNLRRVPAHISEFTPFAEPLALPRCGSNIPPEPLLTPDPLLPVQEDSLTVRVSFIVGSDGFVHSAFVLDGVGSGDDEAVLRAVRQWRYRPALCNGVPTDSEARVRFNIP